MRNLFHKLLTIVLPLLAGLGVSILADKTVAGKIPTYDEPVTPSLNPKKLVWFIAVFAVGNILFTFISKKLKLKI